MAEKEYLVNVRATARVSVWTRDPMGDLADGILNAMHPDDIEYTIDEIDVFDIEDDEIDMIKSQDR